MKINKSKISQNQYMYIIFSSMLGVGLLALASSLCGKAHQSAWIPVFIGSLYPFSVIVFSYFIEKKTKQKSFKDMSNMIYGKALTVVFSIIFFLFLLTIYVAVISGFTNVARLTITPYLDPIYIILPAVLVTIFVSHSGVYMVGRICEFYFFITLPLLFIPLFLIFKGTLINVLPVEISIAELTKAIPESFYAFTGCEVSYFIISKISSKKSVLKSGLIAVSLICGVYALSVFFITYYLGWEVTAKLEYPLLYTMRSIDFPIVSNFLAIVIFLWGAIILRILVVHSYTCISILSETFNIKHKISSVIFGIIAFSCSFFLIPEYNRKEIIGFIIPYFVGFSVVWGILTTIIVMIKYRGEKQSKEA